VFIEIMKGIILKQGTTITIVSSVTTTAYAKQKVIPKNAKPHIKL